MYTWCNNLRNVKASPIVIGTLFHEVTNVLDKVKEHAATWCFNNNGDKTSQPIIR